jgi:hypothetical protein
MATSKGNVQGSRADEDGQTEMYNKRNWEHLKPRLPKGQLSRQDSKGQDLAFTENSGDFPQKKQKLASPQYQCHDL